MAFKAFKEQKKFTCTESFKRAGLSNTNYDTYLEEQKHDIPEATKFIVSAFPVHRNNFLL